MNRHQALELLPGLERATTHFSSINTAKDLWWLDIPILKIKSPSCKLLTLLLHDNRVAKLHVLEVPTSFFSDNADSLSIRKDTGMISLELSCEEKQFLQNVRPQSSGLHFASFLKQSVLLA